MTIDSDLSRIGISLPSNLLDKFDDNEINMLAEVVTNEDIIALATGDGAGKAVAVVREPGGSLHREDRVLEPALHAGLEGYLKGWKRLYGGLGMSPAKMSRIESASRLALDLNKAFNLHDVVDMSKLISADCILEDHDPAPDGAVYSGRDAISRYWRDLFARSPRIHQEIEDIFGMGNRCVMRWKLIRSEGKDTLLKGIDIYQVRGDLISQIWSYVKG
jgi:predicted SnoaL-like aldol condensation-catalyzing enzyme